MPQKLSSKIKTRYWLIFWIFFLVCHKKKKQVVTYVWLELLRNDWFWRASEGNKTGVNLLNFQYFTHFCLFRKFYQQYGIFFLAFLPNFEIFIRQHWYLANISYFVYVLVNGFNTKPQTVLLGPICFVYTFTWIISCSCVYYFVLLFFIFLFVFIFYYIKAGVEKRFSLWFLLLVNGKNMNLAENADTSFEAWNCIIGGNL